jgi:murein DD-endopeptidase MepM/ murein hydrolase activator NlpD
MKGLARLAAVALITMIFSMVGLHVAFGTTSPAPAVAKKPKTGCGIRCVSATGWVRPVDAEIWGGFRSQNPYNPQHDGVDLGARRNSPIRAASAGTVVQVLCNITPASHGCNRDGTPRTLGCGWYVDIRHPGAIYTRYCHMIRQPLVHVGQTVTAGQIIGHVGSSGHSSAPHLHFEVHQGDQSRNTAVDPIAFMAAHGAPLGTGQ